MNLKLWFRWNRLCITPKPQREANFKKKEKGKISRWPFWGRRDSRHPCFSFCCCLVFCHVVVRLLLFLRLVMGGQAYVVVAVGWRSLLFSLKHSILHCCEILSSWRVGAYPAGGRTFGRLYPSGRIAVVRLTFSCVLSVCVFFLLPLCLVLLDSGPLFRGAACVDFCVKPKGARRTYVWEHVALNPRALLSDCVLSRWWFFVAFSFAFFFFFSLSPPLSWFCSGFSVAFVVQQRWGGILVCRGAGQCRRVFFFLALQFCSFVSVLFPCEGDCRVLAVLRPGVHRRSLTGVGEVNPYWRSSMNVEV